MQTPEELTAYVESIIEIVGRKPADVIINALDTLMANARSGLVEAPANAE